MSEIGYEEINASEEATIEAGDFDKLVALQLPDTDAPEFLREGVACQAICDIHMSLEALNSYNPMEYDGITLVQSAQGTCRTVIMSIGVVEGVFGAKRLNDSRHSAFRRMCKALKQHLLDLEPCAEDVVSDTDHRICSSIKSICNFLRLANTVLDIKSTPAERKEAVKEFARYV